MGISEALYDEIVANTEATIRLKSMSRIRMACDSLDKECEGRPYTVADVGRFCERKWGGPKAQSIRNSPDVLTRYIRIRIAEHTLACTGGDKQDQGYLDLNDLAHAQEKYLLALAEIELLKREISRVRIRLEGYDEPVASKLVEITRAEIG